MKATNSFPRWVRANVPHKQNIHSLRLSVLIVYTCFIVYTAVLPIKDAPPFLFPHQDKLVHFVSYAVLMGITRWSGFIWSWGLAYAIFWATSTEVMQVWVPTRELSVWDFLANLLGIGLGMLASRFFPRQSS